MKNSPAVRVVASAIAYFVIFLATFTLTNGEINVQFMLIIAATTAIDFIAFSRGEWAAKINMRDKLKRFTNRP